MASGNVTGAAGNPGTNNQFDRATILGGLVGTNTGLIWIPRRPAMSAPRARITCAWAASSATTRG